MPDVALQPWKPLPFGEAVRFWESKVPLTPALFAQLRDDAKVRAFAVSGIAKMDILAEVYQALHDAIAEGTSFGEFKKSIQSIIEERGWTGRRAWRVDNIFRTNVQTAYSVGKWARLRASNGLLEYVMYDAVMDSRTRPTHAAMDGQVFRADDAIWDKWWPPNGFRCRCTTRLMSAEEFHARGLKEAEGKDWDGHMVDIGNGRMQALLPDPGFGHNPGKSFLGSLESTENSKEDFAPLNGLAGPAPGDDLPRIPLPDPSIFLPAGQSGEFYRQAFREAIGIPDGETAAVISDILGEPVLVVESLFGHLLDGGGRERFLRLIPQALKSPSEVWLVPYQGARSGRIVLRKHYLSRFESGPVRVNGLLIVAEVERSFCKAITFFPVSGSMNGKRIGVRIFKRGEA